MTRYPRVLLCLLFVMLIGMPVLAEGVYTLSQTGTFLLVNRYLVSNTSNIPVYEVQAKVLVGVGEADYLYQKKLATVVKPKASGKSTDEFGNDYALINLGVIQPGERREILIEKYIENSSITFSQDIYTRKYDYTAFKAKKENARYLAPSEIIQCNAPDFQREAFKFDMNKTTVELAKDAYGGVNVYLTYDTSPQYSNTDALNALRSGRGVCAEFAALFVGMCRAIRIPARVVTGYWASKKDTPLNTKVYFTEDEAHAWAEFYLPEVGWVPVEPTAMQIMAFRQGGVTRESRIPNYDYFATIRPGDRHFIWAHGVEKRERHGIEISYAFSTVAGAPADPNAQYLDASLVERSVTMISPESVPKK